MKAAVLVLALGPDAAAKALRCMRPEAVAELARAVGELERAPIVPELVDTVLGEFRGRVQETDTGVAPSDAGLEKLLAASIGPEKGAGLMKQLEREKRAKNPFAQFAELDAAALSGLLDGELPQVQALVLAHVPAALAGAVLAARPEGERIDFLLRMARLEDVAPELTLEVGAALGGAAVSNKAARAGEGKSTGTTRARAVASVLNVLDADEKSRGLLEKLREKDGPLAQAIEEQTLVFDDLVLLDGRSLQKLLAQVDSKTLGLALKGADTAMAEKLLGNLSKRARETVLEEKELLGPQPLSAVQGAQHEMLGLVRGLIQSGEIKLERGKEPELVQ
jgi:flagellar motor switch protein FliG